MRLSEAIRLGAMMKPQAFHGYFHRGGSCAIGAALDACGHGETDERPTDTMESLWPWAGSHQMHCPLVCAKWHDWRAFPDAARAVIAHLNDHHRWTREQIADWVETIERRLAPRDEVGTADARAADTEAVLPVEIA